MGNTLIIGLENGRFRISGRGENYRTLSDCEPTTPALIKLLKRAEFNPEEDTISDSPTLDFEPEDENGSVIGCRRMIREAIEAIKTERTKAAYNILADHPVYREGQRVTFDFGGIIGTGRVCGLASNGLVDQWVVKVDTAAGIDKSVYPWSCIVVLHPALRPFDEPVERKHYEIISGYTGEVIGCTRGEAGKDEVRAEEPKSTFIEVDPTSCRSCTETGN
jgi:hypothetical protein